MAVQPSRLAGTRRRRAHVATQGCLLGAVVLALCHGQLSSVGAPGCWISGLRLLPTAWWSSYPSSCKETQRTTARASGLGIAQRLDGVVERLRHPFAEIRLSLPNGTSALGSLHVTKLRKGWVEDISEHLSVGEDVSVSILAGLAAKRGRLRLSAHTSLTEGKQVSGTVQSIHKAGLVVSISNEKEEVLLPWSEGADDIDDVHIGARIGSLWIMSVGERRLIGTLRPSLTPEARKKFAEVMERGHVFDGVVESVKHPWAYMKVTLADGTSGLGSFHAAELCRGIIMNISECITIGDVVPVKILNVAEETGHMSLSAYTDLAPGQKVYGTVSSIEESGNIQLSIRNTEEEVFVPRSEIANDVADVEIGRRVGPLWIMSVTGGNIVGTFWPGRAMTAQAQAKFASLAEPDEVFEGVVKHIKHPLAYLMVTLSDGTSGLGTFHAAELRRGLVENISEHLSIGEVMPVRLRDGSIKTGRLSLSACPSLALGQEVTGTVQRVEASHGIVVEVSGCGEEVLLPWSEGAHDIDDVEVGSAIGPLWIMREGQNGLVGTLWPGSAMTLETQAKLAAAMEPGNMMSGVVKHVKHPWACVMLTLEDGSSTMGRLHASQIGDGLAEDISEQLSIGDHIPVSIMEMSAEPGRPARSGCSSLTAGQEVIGIVARVDAVSGNILVEIANGEKVLIRHSEYDGEIDYEQVGNTIGPLQILQVGVPGRRTMGTLWPGRAMTPEVQAKFAAATELGHVFDGVVKYIKHPLAFLGVTLADGTAAVGSLHAAQLRKGNVANISEHVSIGEVIQVKVLDAGSRTGRLCLTHVSLREGQEVTGRIQRIEAPYAIVVAIDDSREEVLLPWSDGAPIIDDLYVGRRVGPIAIISVGPSGGRSLGTLWPGKWLTPETQAKFAAAMQPGHVFNGIVKHVFEQHPWAYIMVTLPDGTSGLGSFQERELLRSGVRNVTERLSLGDYVPVHIDATGSMEKGGLVLSPCVSWQAASYKNAGSVVSRVWTGRAIHSEIEAMYTIAMKPPRVFDGIVDSVTHSLASITVMLPGATPAQGFLHAVHSSSGWGMSERLSVGEHISVRALGVDLEQGVLLLHD